MLAAIAHAPNGPQRVLVAAFVSFVALASGSCTSTQQQERIDRHRAFEVEGGAPTTDPRAEARTAKPKVAPGEYDAFEALANKLDLQPRSIENPCLDTLCNRRALDRIFEALDDLDRTGKGTVRILHLGDSHIAADLVTRTIRSRLQKRFGDGGRGFVVVDQRSEFGGRRLRRKGWRRLRIVDKHGPRKPFGFAGMMLRSTRRGAYASYRLEPDERRVTLYYYAHPRGAPIKIYVENELVLSLSTRASSAQSRTATFDVPEHREGSTSPPDSLVIRAEGSGAMIFGLSFESVQPGIIYDSIGPVGADAKVYLQLEQRSFKEHLKALRANLIVLMVGGNDALMVRQGSRTMAEVRRDHARLIKKLKAYSPRSDCLLWAPMDAGERTEDGQIVTRDFVTEVRDVQREVALELGCGFWDTFEAMGGENSFGRWLAEGIMNEDLVHPRSKGGDLLGHLFALSLTNTYLGM